MPVAPALLLGLSLCVVAPVLAPQPAHAGVPRSCMARSYDPIRCPRETRQASRDVLGTARILQLERQREELARIVVPLQDAERNRLLREVVGLLRYPAPRR